MRAEFGGPGGEWSSILGHVAAVVEGRVDHVLDRLVADVEAARVGGYFVGDLLAHQVGSFEGAEALEADLLDKGEKLAEEVVAFWSGLVISTYTFRG